MRLPKLPDRPLPSLPLGSAQKPLRLPDLGFQPRPFTPASTEKLGKVEQAEAAVRELSAFQQRAKTEAARFQQVTDSEYWACLCFETRQQKEEFLRKLGLLGLGDKHIDGLQAAAILGIELTSPRVTWPQTTVNQQTAKLARG